MNNELYLKPNYTFENFIVGKSNERAYLCCAAIATTLEGVASPVVLYGGEAVGKTHLLHAVANYILKTASHKKIVYSNGEMFNRDVRKASLRSRTDDDIYLQLVAKYKEADILIVEDIDSIFDESESRKMFLELLRELRVRKSKVIMSSQIAPKNLMDSRSWRMYLHQGNEVQIREPNFDTRYDILVQEAKQGVLQNFNVPSDVITCIANKEKNIRKLIGKFRYVVLMYRAEQMKKVDTGFVMKCYRKLEEIESKENVEKYGG